METELRLQQAHYAELIVGAGLRLQPRQRLLITGGLDGADIYLAPFVRLIAGVAYRAGARLVDVVWDDPQLRLLRFREAAAGDAREHSAWPVGARMEFLNQGDALLSLYAQDPDLLHEIDATLVSANRNALLEAIRPAFELIERNAVNWCVASAPIPSWAAKVFPNVPSPHQEFELWKLILHLCRADQPDPVGTWQNIARELAARAAHLTARQYSSLTFKGPGTHLNIGLPPGHVWHGGETRTRSGAPFTANIPTEEVFTLPHKEQVHGTVRATRPLSYAGATIDRFQLAFDKGRVTDFSAEVGEPRLKGLIATDEGTCRLGEVALVSESSPISKSGVVLHNPLFDENAASHLALGFAYRFCMKGAETMTNEEFASAGGNTSRDHVDFMIGSSEIDVDARTSDGLSTPLMRHGEWAFEV